MKSAFISLALFVAVALGQSLQINTPSNVVQCEPTLLNWSGGTPPYFLSILPGNQPSAAALENLGQQTTTSLTWKTDIQAGTSIGLTIRDSTGATASSAAFSVNSGSDSSCLNGGGSSGSSSASGSASGSSASSSAASSSASSSAAPTTSSAASSTPASSTAPAPTTTSKPSTTAAPSSTSKSGSATSTAAAAATSTGAAVANMANLGAAGVIGAAVMAFLA